MQYYFLQSTPSGSHWIECDVKAVLTDGKFRIEFFDDLIFEASEKIVDITEIKSEELPS